MRLSIAALFALALAATACGGATDAAVTDDADLGGESSVISETEADADASEALKADAAGLTTTQSRNVLKAIDDICGDTWCEGDFNYAFKRITCTFSKKTCTLSVDVIDYSADAAACARNRGRYVTGDSEGCYYPRSCKMTSISAYTSMVSGTAPNLSLKQGFFDKVSTCIDKWSPTIPMP